jgi:hypothetical protein
MGRLWGRTFPGGKKRNRYRRYLKKLLLLLHQQIFPKALIIKLIRGRNRRQFPASALVEGDLPVRKGEKSVIAATTNIRSRMDLCSALAGYNCPCFYKSAIRRFYSQIFGI